MLKKIPKLLSPELVCILMQMGHGDEIVLADANFPAHSHHSRVIRMDGIDIPPLLDAILELLPLDHYAEEQLCLMEVVQGDSTVPEIWKQYEEIVSTHDSSAIFGKNERFEFYSRSRTAYAIVVTGERALYGNIILKKGVL